MTETQEEYNRKLTEENAKKKAKKDARKEELAKKRAEEKAKREATIYKYLTFIPFLIFASLIAVSAPPHGVGWHALIIGIGCIGLIFGYVVYSIAKESLYRKYYEEELAILQEMGGANEK